MITVWCDDTVVGEIRIERRPGFQRESTTFTYDPAWLSSARAFSISPDLPLVRGPQYPATHRSTFLAFDDAAPNRWGRRLIWAEHRRSMSEIDLLLAVPDETRQGALRFSQSGMFLAPSRQKATLHDLPTLVAAAEEFNETGHVDDRVSHLIGVGSSPGGARPKAWVLDEHGVPHLAKFPMTSDVGNISAWEHVAALLQHRAGIQVPDTRLIPLENSRSILLSHRFDRAKEHRLPYLSFKSAFALQEGEHPAYSRLATWLQRISHRPKEDAPELFKRAAFSTLVNNIDDHMRNHGLLRGSAGWRLSPPFDVNPSRFGTSDTPLTENSQGPAHLEALIASSQAFLMSPTQATDTLKQLGEAVSVWKETAISAGIGPDEVENHRRVFENDHMKYIAGLS